MATRSYIGLALPSGKIKCVYCHSDGYVEHHGPILLNHYDTQAKVIALLRLGSLSVLGAEIGRKHSFGLHWDLDVYQDWCLAYRRDRGDPYIATKTFLVDSPSDMDEYEHNYLFKDGMWWLASFGRLTDLRAAIITELLT